MKYTAEQLAGMSDYHINAVMNDLVNPDGVAYYEDKNFCSDWSATGPLMVKYGVATVAEDGKIIGATNNSQEFYEPHGSVVFDSQNKNPLRAICEVILMMGE